jgi:hypothetical protein
VTIALTQRPTFLAEWALQKRPIGQSMLLSQGIDGTAERAGDNGITRTANAVKINIWNNLVILLSLENESQARRGRLH